VNSKAVDTCFNIHTAAFSAWSHVGLVVEIACATPHQEKENNAKPESKMPLCHSCGAL
jgi:hypothetical protein